MSDKNTLPFLDLNDWQPENKAWMQTRKQEWRFVQQNLKAKAHMLVYSKSYIKAHKAFFFKGEIDYQTHEDKQKFGYKLVLFVIWYHPKLTDKVCEALLDYVDTPVLKGGGVDGATEFLTSYGTAVDYDKDYGFMGGREQWAAKYIFGDRAKAMIQHYFDRDLRGAMPYSLPKGVANSIITTVNGKKSPWSVHQYLWDKMLAEFDEAEQHLFFDEEYIHKRYTQAFQRVLFYEEHRIVDSTNPYGRALRDKIFHDMETRDDIPERLAAIWEQVKADGLPEEYQRQD